MRFDGKTVIVTGAASGIGRACAERFAREGASVVLADIDAKAGAKAAAAISGSARFVDCDVGEPLDVKKLVATTLDVFGGIDVLINNAAVIDSAPFLELSAEDLDRVLRVNLRGAFLVAQAVAKHMVVQVKKGGAPGAIVNMSSVNAVFALPDHVAYSIAKGGIAQLTKAMALALAPHGIRVNAIGPGSILTPMLDSVKTDKAAARKILSRTPLGRFGEAEEIAAVAAFLASGEASYVTGTTVYADGGRLPLNYTVEVAGQD